MQEFQQAALAPNSSVDLKSNLKNTQSLGGHPYSGGDPANSLHHVVVSNSSLLDPNEP